MSISPVASPKQATSVILSVTDSTAFGPETVALISNVHPKESLIITVYVPTGIFIRS